jgi:hypothetical protein
VPEFAEAALLGSLFVICTVVTLLFNIISVRLNRSQIISLIFIIVLLGGVFVWVKHYDLVHGSENSSVVSGNEEYHGVTTGTCVECHSNVVGLAPGHREIECSICHAGNNMATDIDSAHQNMVVIPGNFADMDQTCAMCHAEAVQNIRNSIMSTNSGIVTIDKFIYGEVDSPDGYAHILEIAHSAADEHLRNLCAHCHLGNEKTATGPVSQLSRGGGCNACHLNYSETALAAHALYKKDSILPKTHPSIDLNVTDDHCFGCHSRSGRISTNYQGYHETLLKEKDIRGEAGYRVLEDDRVFKYIAEDLHHNRGLSCIDCHGYAGVMGDGKLYQHEEEAVKIGCEDCHTENFASTIVYDSLDFTSKRILALRKYKHADKQLLTTDIDNTPILNAFVGSDKQAFLVSKQDRKLHPLRAPSTSCSREFGHQDLTCSSCHTNWAPQCIGCHIDYDANANGYDLLEKTFAHGSWIEYAGEFLAEAPTLGVRIEQDNKSVEVAIPGMIMTWDKDSYAAGEPTGNNSFYRLFAPAKPHTTSAAGRNCKSCHNNPVALGYGRGTLEFQVNGSDGRWQFESAYEIMEQDSLPADAWTGFLQEPRSLVSTRTNFRPFTVEEQQRMLTVGACLTCHSESSTIMTGSIREKFADLLLRMTPDCKKPTF